MDQAPSRDREGGNEDSEDIAADRVYLDTVAALWAHFFRLSVGVDLDIQLYRRRECGDAMVLWWPHQVKCQP